MKGKLIITAVVASLVAGNAAFASIARQAVFGGQPSFTTTDGLVTVNAATGGLWYDDDYNVFYNPAYVNDYKNFATVSKGTEGGWFSSFADNFAYGIYMNRGGGAPGTSYAGGTAFAPGLNQQTRYFAAARTNGIDTQRPIDFFIAGDTGVKWGLHVAWAYNRNQTTATNPNNGDVEITNRYWHFDLGAEVMGFEPYVGTTLFSKYQEQVTGSAKTLEQSLGELNAGLRYKYEGWTPYVAYKNYREGASDFVLGSQTATSPMQKQARHSMLGFGVGHDSKVADGVHIYKHIGYWMNDVQDDAAATELGKNFREKVIPFNLAIEADATSWLVLRAGATFDFLRERVFDNTTAVTTTNVGDRAQSQAGRTTFRIGSTFKFGKLHVDSVFGTGAAATTPGTENIDSNSFGFDAQTFAAVSASYHW